MSRYIDADMLYVDWYDSFVADDGTVYDNFPLISKEQIDNAPTIKPKRGEWIEHKGRTIVEDNNFIDFFPTEYECSNCGLRQATYFINSKLPNFCPNCGADMRKETVDYKSVVLICDEEGNWSMHGERKENE